MLLGVATGREIVVLNTLPLTRGAVRYHPLHIREGCDNRGRVWSTKRQKSLPSAGQRRFSDPRFAYFAPAPRLSWGTENGEDEPRSQLTVVHRQSA